MLKNSYPIPNHSYSDTQIPYQARMESELRLLLSAGQEVLGLFEETSSFWASNQLPPTQPVKKKIIKNKIIIIIIIMYLFVVKEFSGC